MGKWHLKLGISALLFLQLSCSGSGFDSSSLSAGGGLGVFTLVGNDGGGGTADGTGSSARFNGPDGITTDGTNLYVADSYNNTIRKIVIATGVVTTLAGTPGTLGSTDGTGAAALFNFPNGLTTDGTNLYIADSGNNTIRKMVIATGVVTTLAGTAGASGSTDATGSAARFNDPFGITVNGGNLYVADELNHTIRQIVISSGVVTTLAGTAGVSGSTDGTGSAARFNYPNDLTTDGTNLYVSDRANDTIRKIVISSGVVTTLAGTAGSPGATDATGSAARFNYPAGITTDGTNLYVVETTNGDVRQIVISSGVVTTLGGTAPFSSPYGVTVNGANLYVADSSNNTIRQLVISSQVLTTFAGLAAVDGATNGTGSAATFGGIYSMTTDGVNLYVTDNGNDLIRKITPGGVVTTLAGGGLGSTDGTGSAAKFNYPDGMATDGTNLYVTDRNNDTIRQIVIATGVVTTLAGTAGSSGSTDGTGAAARFHYPNGIATDGTNLYVSDYYNYTIRKIVIATGVVTTLAGAGSGGSTDGTGSAARFSVPGAMATDGTNLYVIDNCAIRKIVIASAVVTTLAGNSGTCSYANGTGSAALFNNPDGITTDGTNLYVADFTNSVLRKVVISSGVVTTYLGNELQTGSIDGSLSTALVYQPEAILYWSGNLYFATDNNVRVMP